MKILPINSYYRQKDEIPNCHKNNTTFRGEFINTGPIVDFMYEASWNNKIDDVITFKNLLEKIKKVNDNTIFWLEQRTLYKQQKHDKNTKEVLAVCGSDSNMWCEGDSLILNKINKALETFYEDKLAPENEEEIIEGIVNELLLNKKL